MPLFSQASLSKLSTCHPDLQKIFFEVIKSYDCKILEGYRNKEQQEEAYKNGRTKLHWPNGNHNKNPSNAVDVSPCPINFSDDQKNIARYYHFAGYVLAIANTLKFDQKISHNVRWGGDWDSDNDFSDQSFNDLVHFELVGV